MNKIDISLVKELRERTGVSVAECKKALEESRGNIDLAIEFMRKSGVAKAEAKELRDASEGIVFASISSDYRFGTIIEINCETDFVSKSSVFIEFVERISRLSVEKKIDDLSALTKSEIEGRTIDQMRIDMISKTGENVQIRKLLPLECKDGFVYKYVHMNKVCALVGISEENVELGKDVAMHIAASKPKFVNSKNIDIDVLEKEKEIYRSQFAELNKPSSVIEKMVTGKLQKFIDENVLERQYFIKNSDIRIYELAESKQCKILSFIRLELGNKETISVDS